jgi:hypothetical protein
MNTVQLGWAALAGIITGASIMGAIIIWAPHLL